MYILDKVFLPLPPPVEVTWFFWNIIGSRIKKKRHKKERWRKVFRDTRSDFLPLLLGRFRRCRILKAYIFRSHYLAYLSRRLPRDPILLRPSPLLQHTRIHLHKGVRETNVTGKNPYVALPSSSPSSPSPPSPSPLLSSTSPIAIVEFSGKIPGCLGWMKEKLRFSIRGKEG